MSCLLRGLKNAGFHLRAVGQFLIDGAFSADSRGAGIRFVFVSPAWFRVPFVGLAVRLIFLGAFDNAPARNEGVDSLDAGDAEFQLTYSAPDALEPFHVMLAVAPVVRVGFVGYDKPFALVQPECEDRDAEHPGDRAY